MEFEKAIKQSRFNLVNCELTCYNPPAKNEINL
jgi:hypothetical protein